MSLDAQRVEPGADFSWTFDFYQSELTHEQSHLFEWSETPGSGILDGFVLSRLGAHGECEVMHLVCAKRGKGTSMMEEWFAWARLNAVERVFLEFHHENLKAQKLYQKLGFVEIAIRPKYYSNGGDAILMSRQL